MAKTVDITEKLTFAENPRLLIKNVEYEVNCDALTMLRVMQLVGAQEPAPEDINFAYEALFTEKERKKIEKLKPSFYDFTTIVKEAVNLVVGEPGQGE